MNSLFTQNISKYIQESPYLKKDDVFRWLNPVPENINLNNTSQLLSKLPPELQDMLLNDSNLKNFFEDDVRALQLYIQTIPISQILSEETLDDHIQPEDFNTFFRESYITNQAYKLSPEQREKYSSQVSKNQTWQEYIQLENIKNINPGKVEPNYSIRYFLTNLNPVSRLEYLQDIQNEPTDSLQSEKDLTPVSDLPELSTLLNFNTASPNIEKQNYNIKNNTNNIENQTIQESSLLGRSEVSNVNNTDKSELSVPQQISNTTSQTSLNIQTKEQLESSRVSQLDQTLQSNVVSQKNDSIKQNTKAQTAINQTQKEVKIQLPVQSPIGRRKPVNYAKIVGYSSAAGLSVGTGGITLLNLLFGS